MYIWFYLFLMILMGQLNTALSKKFQMDFTMDSFHFVAYTMITSAFACVTFYILSGFFIDMNLKTFLFAFGYALIVTFSIIFQIFLYSKLTVSLVSILGSSGNIITSSLFGILFLSEKLSVSLLISMILMLLGIILPFFNTKQAGSSKKTHIWLCIIQFLVSGLNTIYSKLFANATGVTDTNSYFFMTNFIMFAISLIITIVYSYRFKLSCLKAFNFSQLSNMAVKTLISNLSSLLSIIIIAALPVSIYTIITSSCGLIGSAFLSRFYFKEPMPLFNKLALLCAVAAIIIAPN